MLWVMLHPSVTAANVFDYLGYIPDFFDGTDKRPAAEQVNARYIGGWMPLKGWHPMPKGATLADPSTLKLAFPGDPVLEPLVASYMPSTGELVVVYSHGVTAIFQPDMTFEASRLD